jgi:hypothetical protein
MHHEETHALLRDDIRATFRCISVVLGGGGMRHSNKAMILPWIGRECAEWALVETLHDSSYSNNSSPET